MLWDIFSRKDDEYDESIDIQKWLSKNGVSKDSFNIYIVEKEKLSSTEEFLEERGIDQDSLSTNESAHIEMKHQHFARNLILLSLVIPMSIVPFWLMALLSLPIFIERKIYSGSMQAAFLAALVSDYVGLYYIVTSDLFPKGRRK